MSISLPAYLEEQAYPYQYEKLRARANSAPDAGAGGKEYHAWREIARPDQLPPDSDWIYWLLLGGRGSGKTRAGVEWAIEQAHTQPGSRGLIIGATAGDIRDVIIEGESGILEKSPPDFVAVYEPSKRRVTWPNGSVAYLRSADTPERLRGPQAHWALCDEMASWRYLQYAWDMLQFCLRLGNHPRAVIATTPRPLPLLKMLLSDPDCVLSSATTYDNLANLSPVYRRIIARYEGTTLGQQELLAKLLSDNPRALWKRDNIETLRVTDYPPLVRIVVAIDPQAKKDAKKEREYDLSDTVSETGIVIAGLGEDGHGYVLDDLTLNGSPDEWGRAAVTGFNKYRADRIVGEVNNGGDMVEFVVKTVEPNIPFTQLHASRGKHTRAEPVAALYEQFKVHHVGMFAELEDQMCQWVPGDDSPDRMDALVWALTELMLDGDQELSEQPAPDWLSSSYRDY